MRDEQFVFFHLDAGQFLSQLLGIFNKQFRLANKRIENICQESCQVLLMFLNAVCHKLMYVSVPRISDV